MKSSRMTPDIEFSPVDMVLKMKSQEEEKKEIFFVYLSAALKTPETKIPGKPGI